jgi:hypothetical protein
VKRATLTLLLGAGLLLGPATGARAAEFLTPGGVTGGDGGTTSPTDTWCEALGTPCPADR